jgi:hypothetical protein
MMRRHWGSALSIFVAALLGFSAAATERSAADDLPRSYTGSFKWDDSSALQSVAMAFRSVTPVGGDILQAEGCGVYNGGGRITTIRVKMTVRLPSLAVTISELDPIDKRGFVVDGSHEGHLSDDLQVIDAIWTTRETGEHGRLRLHAAPGVECEPLHESSVATSIVPIAALPGTTRALHQQRRPSP